MAVSASCKVATGKRTLVRPLASSPACFCMLTSTRLAVNQRNLFDENYGLASTQALKNKDIPEGGSKGVILPDIGASPRLVFEKYVDSSACCFPSAIFTENAC